MCAMRQYYSTKGCVGVVVKCQYVIFIILIVEIIISIQSTHSFLILSPSRVPVKTGFSTTLSPSSHHPNYAVAHPWDTVNYYFYKNSNRIAVRTTNTRRCGTDIIIRRVVSKSDIVGNNQEDDDNEYDDGSSPADTKTTITTTTTTTSNVDNNNNNNTNIIQIIKASLLIAGTTVGGGFLAVPQSILIPLGGQFIPAAISLSAVWLFLFLQSIYLSDAIIIHTTTTRNTTSTSDYRNSTDAIGIAACVQRSLLGGGNSNTKTTKWVSTVTIIFLFVLTEATLVSQLSRAGSLFANAITTPNFGFVQSSAGSMIDYRIGCLLATIIGAIGTFGIRKKFVTSIHSVLTIIFLFSVGAVLSTGNSIANWSNCFTTPHQNSIPLSGIGQALPTMLQLLVYGEIIPTVCSMLQYNIRSIRIALLVGSFIPLILLGGWAAFAIALLPSNVLSGTTTDPVNILLSQGGSISRWLYTLAISAIGTTIIGCNLALETNYNDMIQLVVPSPNVTSSLLSNHNNTKSSRLSRDRWLPLVGGGTGSSIQKYSWILIPPFLISIISPSLFLQAIDFAGSYPVLLLYGVIPSFLRLRRSSNQQQHKWWKLSSRSIIPYILFILSISMVSIETISDLQSIVKFLFQQVHNNLPINSWCIWK